MSKNKSKQETRTIRENETQKLTGERNVPEGADKRGGQSPK